MEESVPAVQHKELRPHPGSLTNREVTRFAEQYLFAHKTLPYEWQREIVKRLAALHE